jgi:hypothetical protein
MNPLALDFQQIVDAGNGANFLTEVVAEPIPPAPVAPALPWDLQPSISDVAQDDPLLGALKRQVQRGLFSIPEQHANEFGD